MADLLHTIDSSLQEVEEQLLQRFNATMRFWIIVVSLKRPPTLSMIASSLSASSMAH